MGGCAFPQRKTRICLTLPLNIRTCCCRESMKTTRIKMMRFTWTGSLGKCYLVYSLAPASGAVV